jgi:hopanoid biosynthesis associated protein HpnK
MVAGPAAADAVARARRAPSLKVGLHVVTVDGRSMLPPERLPHLVDDQGMLRQDLTGLALTLARSAGAREEMRAEIEAQFQAFAKTGLPLDHVNAHKHYHLNPIVGALLIEVGARYGMKGLRTPREDKRLLRRLEPTVRPAAGLVEDVCAAWVSASARRRGLLRPDWVFGLRWSGAMGTERLRGLLGALPPGLVEIYLHPATCDAFEGAASGYAYRAELEALLDEGVAAALRRSAHRAGGYADAGAPS